MVIVLLGTWAQPASAHVGGMGTTPWDYATTVSGVVPPVPGLSLQVHEGGNWLVLTDLTGREVVVLGYLGEPYLRVGPSGAFENRNSPSLYLAQAGSGASSAPAVPPKGAPAAWLRIGSGPSLGWHDHRVHWADPLPPPEVVRDPSVAHVVIPDWHIPLLWNGRTVVVSGDVLWKPGPSPWPWFGMVAGTAAAIVVLGWSSRRTRWMVGVAIVVGTAADVIWVADRWQASYVSVSSKLDGLLAVLGAVVFGWAALALMARRGSGRGMSVAVITGVCLVCDVLPENGVWRFSDVPTSLSADAVRVLALVTLSCAIGLVVLGWHRSVWLPAPDPERSGSGPRERAPAVPA